MVSFGSGAELKIVISAVDQATAGIQAVQGKLGGLGDAAKKLRVPLMAVGAAAVGAAGLSIKSFSDYETAMAKVNTLLDKGQDATQTYGDAVKRLATEYSIAGGQVAVATGLYQTISAGITDAAEATIFMESAVKSSIGGSAELETVILAGTKALAAFGLEVSETERVFDVFAATVKAGQTTMPELASAFPQVSGSAGEMGMSIEETAGILAGLTKILPSTDEAATSLQAVLMGLLKPSEEMKNAFEALGVESGKVAVQQFGLMGTLERLKTYSQENVEANKQLGDAFIPLNSAFEEATYKLEAMKLSGTATKEELTAQKTSVDQAKLAMIEYAKSVGMTPEKLEDVMKASGDTTQKMGELFGNVRALRAVFPALGSASKDVSDSLEIVQDSAGLTADQFEKMEDTTSAKFTKMQNKIMDLAIRIGEKLIPIIEKLMPWVEKAVDWFSKLDPVLQAGVLVVGVLVGAIALLAPAISTVIGLIGGASGLMAILTILTGPIGLIVLAVTALALAWTTNFGGIRDITFGVINAITGFFTGLVDAATSFGKNLVENIVNGIRGVGHMIADVLWGLIPEPLRSILKEGLSMVGGVLKTIPGIGNVMDLIGLQEGGIVTRPTLAVVGERGPEAVVPLNQLGGMGGRTISIHIEHASFASDYDADMLARRIAEKDEEDLATRMNV